MARLNKHGKELLRIERVDNLDGDLGFVGMTSRTTLLALMEDGTILRSFRFVREDGSKYNPGWKVYRKLNAGVCPHEKAAAVRDGILSGRKVGWSIKKGA